MNTKMVDFAVTLKKYIWALTKIKNLFNFCDLDHDHDLRGYI